MAKIMEEQLNLKHIEITLSVQITRQDRDCDRHTMQEQEKTYKTPHNKDIEEELNLEHINIALSVQITRQDRDRRGQERHTDTQTYRHPLTTWARQR